MNKLFRFYIIFGFIFFSITFVRAKNKAYYILGRADIIKCIDVSVDICQADLLDRTGIEYDNEKVDFFWDYKEGLRLQCKKESSVKPKVSLYTMLSDITKLELSRSVVNIIGNLAITDSVFKVKEKSILKINDIIANGTLKVFLNNSSIFCSGFIKNLDMDSGINSEFTHNKLVVKNYKIKVTNFINELHKV